MTNPLVGAWELESDSLQGLVIFTETHHCHLNMAQNRKPFSNVNEPTQAEEAEAFRTLECGAGTYSVSGSRLTFNMELHRKPDAVGKPHQVEFSVDGDKLIIKGHRTLVARKVS